MEKSQQLYGEKTTAINREKLTAIWRIVNSYMKKSQQLYGEKSTAIWRKINSYVEKSQQ
jgi:hypothetical protein